MAAPGSSPVATPPLAPGAYENAGALHAPGPGTARPQFLRRRTRLQPDLRPLRRSRGHIRHERRGAFLRGELRAALRAFHARAFRPDPLQLFGAAVRDGARRPRRRRPGRHPVAQLGTGENYLYPMNGTPILSAEGYLRTVPDPSWRIAGLGDFNGDGKADILWRNSGTGENYVYLMNGTLDRRRGLLRTVADQTGRSPASATSTATARATSSGATPRPARTTCT